MSLPLIVLIGVCDARTQSENTPVNGRRYAVYGSACEF